MKMILAAAAAVAMLTVAPAYSAETTAKGDNLKIAQAGVDVRIGREREEPLRREDRIRDRRDRDVTVGVGPGGVVVGPRRNCRTVTTMVERDDGRRIKRTERRCD